MKLKNSWILFVLFFFTICTTAQTAKTFTASEILMQIKKLNVHASVLYIAAHPDDENTRLLGYLANEKLYRTGYLSLTRGDGGQNLIGDEQGIDLGLIRTQELLAARRVDGAEQFFSRAFDFGYSKNPDETFANWGHDKILSDIVWIIRKFKPDVIIARFPTTGEGGHGHHTASAILAGEAFDAAADTTKFSEQFKQGVTTWQAKRLLWNTFNFGGNNTQREDQFKIDVGGYNPLLGKSYGEIAALSRSQHKSQGFGVPAQRGTSLEYFKTLKGQQPTTDLMDGVNTTWGRQNLKMSKLPNTNFEEQVMSIIKSFDQEHPEKSVPALVKLYKDVEVQKNNFYTKQKLQQIQNIIEQCSGLFLEASTNTQYAVIGDSLKINVVANNRLGANIKKLDAQFGNAYYTFDSLRKNANLTYTLPTFVAANTIATQPYWLTNPMEKGSFTVKDQQLIGMAQNEPTSIKFTVNIEGKDFVFEKPIRYKYTDPVKGELYQPIYFIPSYYINTSPSVIIFNSNSDKTLPKKITVEAQSNTNNAENIKIGYAANGVEKIVYDSLIILKANEKKRIEVLLTNPNVLQNEKSQLFANIISKKGSDVIYTTQNEIKYDHIPVISYPYVDAIKILNIDLKIVGSSIGYINGAGDKVPQALEQMGYKVTLLKEADINPNNLKQFDAIVTGVRAYNTNEWMNNVYENLMQYVKDGGVLLTQYNTSNQIGPVKAKIAPYPFSISRNRITDETATVNFLLPNHPVLNYPNKITEKDFEGWIQERSIYHAEGIDSNYKKIFSMKDPGEKENDGSLIVADYGKGRFIYTGLVFFRELPAAVPGAYRLFANLIAATVNPTEPLNLKIKKAKN
jgi:LmbE family N-acetylglucosaminyl deacetylase